MAGALLQRGAVRPLVDLDGQVDGGDLQGSQKNPVPASRRHHDCGPAGCPRPGGGDPAQHGGQGDGVARLQGMDFPEVIVHPSVMSGEAGISIPDAGVGEVARA